MKALRSLTTFACLSAAAFAQSSAPQATVTQVGVPTADGTGWQIATVGPDGVVHVEDFVASGVPPVGADVITSGIAVGFAAPPDDDIAALRRAARILAERGLGEDARRLSELAEKFAREDGLGDLEDKAKQVLTLDVGDRSVRAKMIDVIADGYAVAGKDDREQAMRWFAQLARLQEAGSNEVPQPLPTAIAGGDGTTMDRLIRIVEEGAKVHDSIGADCGSDVCRKLARFYHMRSAGETGVKAETLTTIEKRVPILGLAKEAYELQAKAGNAQDDSLAYMTWMEALGRARVQDGVEVPPVPGQWTIERLIEQIDCAGKILDDAGRYADGQRCHALAEYYAMRERGEVEDLSRASAGQGMNDESAAVSERQAALQDRILQLQARLSELTNELEEVRSKIDD